MERTDFEQWRAKEVARLLALVEAERRYYQEMVAALPAPLVVLAAGGSLVYANRAFRRLFGLRSDDVRRKSITQIISAAGLDEAIGKAHEQGSVEPLVFTQGDRPLRVSILAMRNWDDEAEVETLLLVEDAPSGSAAPSPQELLPVPAPLKAAAVVWQADAETLAFERVEGQPLLGHAAEHWLTTPEFFEQRIHPEDRAATLAFYRTALAAGSEATAEFRALTASGETIWCRETIGAKEDPRAITGVLTDITRRKTLEQQLLTAARQDALQSFSARLSHDLNNALMIASGYGEELLLSLSPQSPERSDVAELLAAIKRIAGMGAQLTEFSRRHASAPTRVDVNAMLDGLGPDLVRVAGAGTTVEITASPVPVWVSVDAEQLKGVILALASGVREGAAERTKVSLTCAIEALPERVPGAMPPAKYAVIHMRDDGQGIDPARRAALFESILPEKDPSGSSWALSRAYALLREWGGDLSVESAPGQGSKFRLYLPYLEPEPEPERVPEEAAASEAVAAEPEAAPAPVPQLQPFRETILVVDDEAGIRGLVRKILRRERYQVLEAGSAEDALTIAVSHAGPIHLLLTDVMLPGLSGPDLARRMYEAAPSLRVLYISGYTEDESVRSGEYPPGSRFLPKPFTLGALVASVRETLDA